jgi:hypothetical protein
MNDTATLGDFRRIGAEHGRNAVRCILAAIAEGETAPAIRWYHQNVVLPNKVDELKALGATDREAREYVRASWNTSIRMLDKLSGAMKGQRCLQRRRQPSCA